MQKTIKRLEEKVQGKVLNQILYALTSSDKIMQQRTALALARLCREEDICRVFVDRKGLDVLLELLLDTTKKEGLPSRESAGEFLEAVYHFLDVSSFLCPEGFVEFCGGSDVDPRSF